VARLTLWIGRESSVDRAQAVIDRIDRALVKLALRPALGRVRLDFEGEPRAFGVAPWLVVYEALPDADGIHVLRSLDTRRDLAALLGKKS
jgi:plasmid stabilization system protein ParE